MKTTLYFHSGYHSNDNSVHGFSAALQDVQKKKKEFLEQNIDTIEKVDAEELMPIYGQHHGSIAFIIKLTYFPKK